MTVLNVSKALREKPKVNTGKTPSLGKFIQDKNCIPTNYIDIIGRKASDTTMNVEVNNGCSDVMKTINRENLMVRQAFEIVKDVKQDLVALNPNYLKRPLTQKNVNI